MIPADLGLEWVVSNEHGDPGCILARSRQPSNSIVLLIAHLGRIKQLPAPLERPLNPHVSGGAAIDPTPGQSWRTRAQLAARPRDKRRRRIGRQNARMGDDVSVGRQVQGVRLARNLRQSDIVERAGVSRHTISRVERGLLEGVTVGTLRAVGRAMGMPSLVTLGWRGPEVERLLDRVHAAMVEKVVSTLTGLGWATAPEHSFNHYGERGAVDVLAWHVARRALLVVETKSRLWDLQSTLVTLDRKRRLLPDLAAQSFGWRARTVGVVLAMPETSAHRHVVERHGATFRAAFPDRQVRVKAWLEDPDQDLRGIWFLSIAHEVSVRQRSRHKRTRFGRSGIIIEPGNARVGAKLVDLGSIGA